MKKILFIILLLAPVCLLADVVDINGDFTDWDDINYGVTDNEDITGTWYYYDADHWSLTCSADCYSVNQEQQLDILDFKITNTTDYLYLYFNTVEPLGKVKTTEDAYVSRDAYGVPAAYNHWLIVGFDNTQDDEYDYYYAINIAWDDNADGFPNSDPVVYIYQDDNSDGAFTFDIDNNPEETLLTTLDSSNFDWALTDNEMEMQLDLLQFLDQTNIDRDTDMYIKLLSDEYLGEATDYFTYNIQEAEDLNEQNAALGVSSTTATGATIWWREVESASQYQVQLRLEDDTFINNYYYLELTTNLTELSSNTAYKFRVRAQVNDSWQDWTDYYSFQTLPSRPSNVRITNKRADKITISWDASSGTVTQYKINLYNLKHKTLQSVYTQDTSYTFTGLKSYRRYRIKIKAYNGDYISKYSKIKKFRTSKKRFYVKIKDLTTTNLDYNTPGADIDSVMLTRDNDAIYYAAAVSRSRILQGTGDRGNRCDDPNAALNGPDAVFVSLGGRGSYIVLKFNKALNYRAHSLTVNELGGSNGGFAEPYRVYVGITKKGPWKNLGQGAGETEFNL